MSIVIPDVVPGSCPGTIYFLSSLHLLDFYGKIIL